MTDGQSFPVDSTAPVREGEELATAALADYLDQHIPGLGDLQSVKQFPAGHSNLTYLLKFKERELVLRRPPFGSQVKSGHDMSREYRVLSHLKPVFETVPKPFHLCESTELLGVPFYVMERVKGVILRGRKGESKPPPELMRKLSCNLVGALAKVHGIDRQAAGLGDWGRPEGYVRRQIEGWTRRYGKAATEEIPALNKVMEWLAANQPGEVGAAIIHNDYKYDNLVLDAGDISSIIAILDWEMATVGDPLMDLGTSLGYWIEAADGEALAKIPAGPTRLPGNLGRVELAEEYARVSGYDLSNLTFYYAFGLFKIMVIAQQIYKRFDMGLTRDKRFGAFIHIIKAFASHAQKVIEKDRIDDLE